jgi:ribosomal protein S18 acetylase RimI-like enzyme
LEYFGLIIRTYENLDRKDVVELWHKTGLYHPDNDPNKDIERKVADSPELFFVATENERVIGTVMVGYEGHRGWINYLGVLPEHQHKSVGKKLMNQAEKSLRRLGCAKINLQVRKTNLAVIHYYESIGYSIEDVISMEKRLEFDDQ